MADSLVADDEEQVAGIELRGGAGQVDGFVAELRAPGRAGLDGKTRPIGLSLDVGPGLERLRGRTLRRDALHLGALRNRHRRSVGVRRQAGSLGELERDVGRGRNPGRGLVSDQS
jgi:hypothetical protein